MSGLLGKLLLFILRRWRDRNGPQSEETGEHVTQQLRSRLRKKLTGFSLEGAAAIDIWEMRAACGDPLEDLPIPPLVLLTLHRLLGYPCLDPGDKGRWAVGCMVDGEPVVFRDRKFGFEILFAPSSKLTWKRVVRPMKAALRVLEEDFLVPLAAEQIHKGRVALINRFGEFYSRYKYFRSKADEQFALAEIRPQDRPADRSDSLEDFVSISAVVAEMNRAAVAEQEAFFLSAAMVDVYFSLLEHRLILLRAFTGKPMAAGDFERLLRGNWEAKLSAVLKLNSKGTAGKVLLGQLRRIKERIRNPFAHGGVENDRGSIYVQVPGFGGLPANFSRYKNSARFNFRPITAEDHSAMCGVFDRLDVMLQADELSLPHRFLDSSVDPMFDPATLGDYAAAIKSGADAVGEWIEFWSKEWERHHNADH